MEHDRPARPERLLSLAARGLDDAIVAVATPPGRGAVGIVRVSGPGPAVAAVGLGVGLDVAALEDRRATVRVLRDGGSVLDRALVLRFVAPHSYTGEDVLELQLHGNPELLERCVACLVDAGARLADPGEFTRRAVRHGRLSLLQAEGVDAVVRAEGLAAARLAQRHLGGELRDRLGVWTAALRGAAAALEASVDYPEDVEPEEVDEALSELPGLRGELAELAARSEAGRAALSGVRAVLVGPVNAGKSTLFNRLLGHARALVSDEAGTTRDVVSEAFEVDGRTVRLEDTAGRRDAAGVEAAGIERGRRAEGLADVVVEVRDGRAVADSGVHRAGSSEGGARRSGVDAAASDEPNSTDASQGAFPAGAGSGPAQALLSADASPQPGPRRLRVATHRDLLAPERVAELEASGWRVVGPKSELDGLRAQLAGPQPSGLLLHTARQRRALTEALAALDDGLALGDEPVLLAQALRSTGRALEELAGAWSNEAVLDELFARFCLGK